MSGQCKATHQGLRCKLLAGDRHDVHQGKHEYIGHIKGKFAWIVTAEREYHEHLRGKVADAT